MYYELIGSAGFELSAAPGEKSEFDSDFRLLGDTDNGGLEVVSAPVLPVDSVRALSVVPTDSSNTNFRITFPPQPLDGEYEVRINPLATDLQQNLLDQDVDGVGGEAEDDRYVQRLSVTRDPLRVVAQNPTNAINGALEEFTVTFNVPIDPNSFATSDARVVGPGGEVTVTSIEQVNGTTFRVRVERTTEDGDYQIFVGPDITDPAGNPMDGDGDAIAGELEDRYEGSLQVAGGGPFVTNLTPTGVVSPGIASAEVTFSEPVRLSNFTSSDVILTGPDGVVPSPRFNRPVREPTR